MTPEEVELRIREAIAPLEGKPINREELTKAVQSVVHQIVTQAEADRPPVIMTLPPDLSQLLREKMEEETEEYYTAYVGIGPDGEIHYRQP